MSDLESELKDTKLKLYRETQLKKISETHNEDLRTQIKSLRDEVHHLRKRLYVERKDVYTQTDDSTPPSSPPSKNRSVSPEKDESAKPQKEHTETAAKKVDSRKKRDGRKSSKEDRKSSKEDRKSFKEDSLVAPDLLENGMDCIAETLKKTAEDAVSNMGYVMDEVSGMYYDYKSGYYYDPYTTLFYDPRTGFYSYYNKESTVFEYHSRVDLTDAGTTLPLQPKTSKKKKKKKKQEPEPPLTKEEMGLPQDFVDRYSCKRDRTSASLAYKRVEQYERRDKTAITKDNSDKEKRKDDYDKETKPKDNCDKVKSRKDDYDKETSRKDDYDKETRQKNNYDKVKSRKDDYDKEKSRKDNYDKERRRDVYDKERRKDDYDKERRKDDYDKETSRRNGYDKEKKRRNDYDNERRKDDYHKEKRRRRDDYDYKERRHSDTDENDDSDCFIVDSEKNNADNKDCLDPKSDCKTLAEDGSGKNEAEDVEDDNAGGDRTGECVGSVESDYNWRMEYDQEILEDEDGYDMEDGELLDSPYESGSADENSVDNGGDDDDAVAVISLSSDCSDGEGHTTRKDEEEPAINPLDYPPCIRLIVTESGCLTLGSLHIITVTGGTIGRLGKGHVLKIGEIGVSKQHARIVYDQEKNCYTIKDLKSQNGTILNGTVIASGRTMSEPHMLSHKDSITMGLTTLRVHIHEGSETCEDCEPGLVQAKLTTNKTTAQNVIPATTADKETLRRMELKNMKKKYKLVGEEYKPFDPTLDGKYEDKAEERRQTVGSDNPYQEDDSPASVERAIDETNKGHQMLRKLGWKEGDSLGKGNKGVKEPVQVFVHSSKAGLGAFSCTPMYQALNVQKTSMNWKKAQERFESTSSQQLYSSSSNKDPDNEESAELAKAKLILEMNKWVSGGVVKLQQEEELQVAPTATASKDEESAGMVKNTAGLDMFRT